MTDFRPWITAVVVVPTSTVEAADALALGVPEVPG